MQNLLTLLSTFFDLVGTCPFPQHFPFSPQRSTLFRIESVVIVNLWVSYFSFITNSSSQKVFLRVCWLKRYLKKSYWLLCWFFYLFPNNTLTQKNKLSENLKDLLLFFTKSNKKFLNEKKHLKTATFLNKVWIEWF